MSYAPGLRRDKMISNGTWCQLFGGTVALGIFLVPSSNAWAAEKAGTQVVTVLFVLIVVGVIAIPMGWYFIAAAQEAFKLTAASIAWPAVPGKVLSSEIPKESYGGELGWIVSFLASSGSSTMYYRPSVRYEYYVEGVRHECDVIEFGELRTKSRSTAEARIKPYPAGATVTVRYDPLDPRTATLETSFEGSRSGYWTGVSIIVIVFLVAATLSLFLGFGWADVPVIVLSLVVIAGSLLFLWLARDRVSRF